MSTARLFMWGFQQHFHAAAKVTAEAIFNLLDRRLAPQVFLLGLLESDVDGAHPVCIEPEAEVEYAPPEFAGAHQRAKQIAASDPERNFIHSNPVAQANEVRRLRARSLQSAVLEVLRSPEQGLGVVSFCSFPVAVHGYSVLVVLQLNAEAFSSHHRLTNDMVDGRYWIARSLLDAAIDAYFHECQEALIEPAVGLGSRLTDRPAEETIRAAGRMLMLTPASAGGSVNGLHGLFEACTVLASLRYESAEGTGKLVIARRTHPAVTKVVTFAAPTKVRDSGATRKLLEVSARGLSLLSDGFEVFALGQLDESYASDNENAFTIEFLKHGTWELAHAGHRLMRVQYGEPQLAWPAFDEARLQSSLRRVFNRDDRLDNDCIFDLLREATRQKRGTMVVISAEAAVEAQRLANQSTVIEPIKATPELVRLFTAIDGAVLIDQRGTCHAIGVILDGIASKRGSRSRGARYNSAVRYIDGKSRCLAIVVSEDGRIDILPDLRPQLRESMVLHWLEKLRGVAKQNPIDQADFNKCLEALQQLEFYLSSERCSEVNALRVFIDRQLSSAAVRIVWRDLKPHEDMNSSYFLEE